MLKLVGIILLAFFMEIHAVVSHGTHTGLKANQDRLTSSLNDALLSYLCRGRNGLPCSGHGQCSGGMCACERGYSGMKCDVNSADMAPMAPMSPMNPQQLFPNAPPSLQSFPFEPMVEQQSQTTSVVPISQENTFCSVQDDSICSGHGLCQGGSCICDQGYSGTICELSSSEGFCNTYKECAECVAFMITCPSKCSKIGTFYLVFNFPNTGLSFRTCRSRSTKFHCYYHFQQEYEEPSGFKSIMVRPCLDYQRILDTNTTTEEPFTTTADLSTQSDMTSHSISDVMTQVTSTTVKDSTSTREDDMKSDRTKGRPGSGCSNVYANTIVAILCLFVSLNRS